MILQTAFSLLLIAGASASPASTTHSPKDNKNPFNWRTTKSVIAFGDSYTFVQGTLGHVNYTYIGDAFNLSFTPSQLFSNRIVLNQSWATQGTAEGGANWVECLTGCGVKKGLTDPRECKVQLWDFAYAGSNTVSKVGFTPAHWNHTVSFEQQVEQFAQYGNPALESIKLRKKDALVAIWIGINDINDLAKLRGKSESFTPLYEEVQNHVFESVEKLYGLGYRNFLTLNLPPLNRGPAPAVNASLVETFNSIHKKHADAFQASHRDSRILQYDVNTALNQILDNYQSYGFKNVTNFCPGFNQPDIRSNPQKYGCGEGLDTYFWYDAGHLGSHTHEVFTKDLRKWLVSKSSQ